MSWSATKARLKAATDALISMSNKLRLAINNDKTQYLVARGGKLSNGETALRVGDSMVRKQGTIDFLGWSVVAKLLPRAIPGEAAVCPQDPAVHGAAPSC